MWLLHDFEPCSKHAISVYGCVCNSCARHACFQLICTIWLLRAADHNWIELPGCKQQTAKGCLACLWLITGGTCLICVADHRCRKSCKMLSAQAILMWVMGVQLGTCLPAQWHVPPALTSSQLWSATAPHAHISAARYLLPVDELVSLQVQSFACTHPLPYIVAAHRVISNAKR